MKYRYFLAGMTELIGAVKVNRLWEYCQDARTVYELKEGELCGIYGITKKDVNKILQQKMEWNLEQQYEAFLKKEIQLITVEDEQYPSGLKHLLDAPYALFVKGKLPDENMKRVAIVGARMCSEYGREIAGRIGEKLGACQVQIISGMAKGVDSAGHHGALRAGGETFAVLGCGTDICYPMENRNLYQQIEKTGGIISEYLPQTPPLPRRFPMRNRIISALSDVIVVVEAKEKSGSLITADFALEQGKEVYAVPGRLTDTLSGGCNRLIKQGAGIILSVEDFMNDLELYTDKINSGKDFSKKLLEKEELLVYSVLDLQPKNIDDIIRETDMAILQVIQSLGHLQDAGFVREIFKNYYIRTLG
jgi:DNA processing protein